VLHACRGAATRQRGAARRVGEERRGEKRGMSGMGATTRGGDDDDGGREERRRFGGKRLSADLEGDRAYIEPPTFCHWSYTKP
jgi:hypothetical protein